MPDFVPVIIYGVLILGVLVFVHELGHFLVAKWLGVRVLSFSIGMGPRLFGFRHGGTDYRISALPLGGFVRMAGESPEDEERGGAPDEFLSKPWWARALITAAGPGANLIFALLVNISVYLVGVEGVDLAANVSKVAPGSVAERVGLKPLDRLLTLDGKPAETLSQLGDATAAAAGKKAPLVLRVERDGGPADLSLSAADADHLGDGLEWDLRTDVGRVLLGFPAYEAGLREGDRITAVDGHAVLLWSDLSQELRSKPDAERTLTVRRGDKTFPLRVKTTPEGTIGISPPETLTFRQTFRPDEALLYGVQHTFNITKQIYAGLWGFVTDPVRLRTTVAGPIAIAQVASQQAAGGVQQLVAFASFISLALMAMNLLPIPILDGGHIFFAVIEGVRRRPLSLKTQLFFQRIGLFVLIGLVVFSFYNDVSRVQQRRRAEADIDKHLRTSAPADTAPTTGH
jgi:regulator of sigma E protease